jgi:hypothetical protein
MMLSKKFAASSASLRRYSKNSSVKLITTRLRDYAYLTAPAGTELSRVIAGFNSKLLHIFKTRLQGEMAKALHRLDFQEKHQ